MEESCRQHGERADLHLQLGLAYLRAVQYDEAVEHLKAASRLGGPDAASRLALACAYDEKGERAKALECLQIANEIKPGESPILFAIGFCLERLQRPQQAMEYYRDAIKADGNFLAARERLAAVAIVRGERGLAIEQYQAMRLACPDKGWVRTALAHLYYQDGQFPQAIEEFESAIAMEPENWSLVDDEVEALVADGQVREAVERLHKLIEQQGPFADLHVRLADLYAQIGDDPAALAHYQEALELQPEYLEATVKLGTHHLVFGRWDQAAEVFHQATELNDALLLNYVGLGVAQAAAGERQLAINNFELAAAIEPNSTLLLSEMARLQLKAAAAEDLAQSFNLEPQATDELELDNDDLFRKQLTRHTEQVSLHPNHADLRYRYGVLLRAEGRCGEAMEQFLQAVAINPCYVQALVKLGVTQQELGQGDQAIETFQKVLDIRPQFVDVHYRLGLLYTDKRELDSAVQHMETAAAGAPGNDHIRAGLALSLQNMGLQDRSAATWRSLWKIHHAKSGKS